MIKKILLLMEILLIVSIGVTSCNSNDKKTNISESSQETLSVTENLSNESTQKETNETYTILDTKLSTAVEINVPMVVQIVGVENGFLKIKYVGQIPNGDTNEYTIQEWSETKIEDYLLSEQTEIWCWNGVSYSKVNIESLQSLLEDEDFSMSIWNIYAKNDTRTIYKMKQMPMPYCEFDVWETVTYDVDKKEIKEKQEMEYDVIVKIQSISEQTLKLIEVSPILTIEEFGKNIEYTALDEFECIMTEDCETWYLKNAYEYNRISAKDLQFLLEDKLTEKYIGNENSIWDITVINGKIVKIVERYQV